MLDRLKNDYDTRHIPTCVITTEEETDHGVRLGAVGILRKPIQRHELLEQSLDAIKEFVDRTTRHLLVIEPNAGVREQLRTVVDDGELRITAVETAKEARAVFLDNVIDCVLSGPTLPDAMLCELGQEFSASRNLLVVPWIVYSPETLSPQAEEDVKRLSQFVVAKHVRSPERLFDQTALFLHQSVAKIDGHKRRLLDLISDPGKVLAGKKVLIVDDDIRNIFALTSVLERHNMDILPAENGRDAIETLKARPDIDIVLMDIMMPEMDGLDTTRAIRKLPAFKNLPIVAVTAKAMKGDREKCIEAGAWDYLSKPVDTDQMLSVLKAWLHR